MRITNLKESPNFFDQCIEVIEDAFDYEETFNFKHDFNTLIQKENLENCFFIVEKNTVTATLFTLPKNLIYKEVETNVLFLGGIAVHPDFRGKGHFNKLFKHIEKTLKGYSLYFLWSDLTGLYEKYSFYEFGIIQEVRSDPNNLKPIHKIDSIDSIKSLHNKLSKDYIITSRTENDWNLLHNNRSIHKYQNDKEEIFLVHKGMDLQNIIHESYPLDFHNETPFIKWNYLPKPETKNLLYMGFTKINNFKMFSDFIYQVSNKTIDLLRKNDNYVVLKFENEEFEIHEKDLIQGLWGPEFIQELASSVPKLLILGFDAT